MSTDKTHKSFTELSLIEQLEHLKSLRTVNPYSVVIVPKEIMDKLDIFTLSMENHLNTARTNGVFNADLLHVMKELMNSDDIIPKHA